MKAWVLLSLLGFASNLFAQTNLVSLEQQILRKNADWEAHENPMSKMPIDQFRRMLGGPREKIPLIRDIEQGIDTTLPAALDWRRHRGTNWVGPAVNQGQCGSCVAFASIAVLETQYKIDAGSSGLKIRLSPQHLFSCGGGSCSWGWNGESAAQYLKSSGAPDEACYPYQSGTTGKTGSCSQTCPDYFRRSVRLQSFSRPTQGSVNLDAIRRALQVGPVVAMLNVYDDFRYYKSGVYRHVTGTFLSGHAVPIIGYNDRERYLIVRNSWGPNWGESGFARISYDDTSALGSWTWSYKTR